jgi:hypothetical protein
MNEQNESENTAPPVMTAPLKPEPPKTKPFSYWAKRLLICNPFYLVSAALLLFGMYQISVDRNLFTGEISQLAFNLTSLEFYEVLLVVTAIFLAARKIWYDSTLLVGLENLLIFVPFILLSQVALISTHVIWVVCLVTVVIAATRFVGLKRYFRELNLPGGLLLIGAGLLAINIGLLATYRISCETKMGWKPDSGRDFVMNQITWLLILPAALSLANFLPHARENGSLEPQRRWLPAGFFMLWAAATGVHLYCLNYVYFFDFRFAMMVPALWVLAWTAFRRAPDIFAWRSGAPRYALALAALLTPLLAASREGTKIFFTLTTLNAAIFGAMALLHRERKYARHLLFASVVLMVCGMPNEWIYFLTPNWERAHYVLAGIAVYLMLYAGLSRNPKLGILGAITVTTGVGILFEHYRDMPHWAVQSGLIFLLLHSLRWEDAKHEGARTVRAIGAALWTSHAVFWMSTGGAMWMPCVPAGILLAAYLITRLLRGRWDLLILPAASLVTVLSGPGFALIRVLQTAPLGILAMAGSLLLFALGTAAALTKNRWHRGDHTSA